MMRRLKSKNLARSYPRQSPVARGRPCTRPQIRLSREDDPVGNFKIRHGGTRCGEHNKINTTAEFNKINIALVDLVAVFTEEAYKICKNGQIARLIALKSLQEYVKRNTDNIKIVL
jgi:hypothetical protein